jgi:hypothetical protein
MVVDRTLILCPIEPRLCLGPGWGLGCDPNLPEKRYEEETCYFQHMMKKQQVNQKQKLIR